MITGNFEDKYNSQNPVSRLLVKNFLMTLKQLFKQVHNPKNIAELGAGEGELLRIIIDNFPNSRVWGSDISKKMINIAASRLKGKKVNLSVEDIEKVKYNSNKFDLVVCCEVLEHVNNPEKALQEIRRISRGRIILSVPNEPLWRVLNMCRGKYLKDFGNTPGHVNNFTPQQFLNLIRRSGFRVMLIKYPLPWQMVLLQKI